MEITIYELLGLVKDGKAPKKVIYDDNLWEFNKDFNQYQTKKEGRNIWDGYNFNILNDTVEILEEEKEIPEKLESYISCGWNGTCKDLKREELFEDLKKIGNKINEIIDCLNSKGDE